MSECDYPVFFSLGRFPGLQCPSINQIEIHRNVVSSSFVFFSNANLNNQLHLFETFLSEIMDKNSNFFQIRRVLLATIQRQ